MDHQADYVDPAYEDDDDDVPEYTRRRLANLLRYKGNVRRTPFPSQPAWHEVMLSGQEGSTNSLQQDQQQTNFVEDQGTLEDVRALGVCYLL